MKHYCRQPSPPVAHRSLCSYYSHHNGTQLHRSTMRSRARPAGFKVPRSAYPSLGIDVNYVLSQKIEIWTDITKVKASASTPRQCGCELSSFLTTTMMMLLLHLILPEPHGLGTDGFVSIRSDKRRDRSAAALAILPLPLEFFLAHRKSSDWSLRLLYVHARPFAEPFVMPSFPFPAFRDNQPAPRHG